MLIGNHDSHGPTILDSDPFEEYDSDYEMDPTLDPEVIDRKSLSWLKQVRIAGLNEKSTTGTHCFISGIGICDDGGIFTAQERGDDPNFPTEEQLGDAPGTLPQFRVVVDFGRKSWTEDGNFFPFHDACYRLLKNLAAGRLGSGYSNDVDATLLFSLFSCGSPGPIESRLTSPGGLELKCIVIDLGYELCPQGQFWSFRRGEEAC